MLASRRRFLQATLGSSTLLSAGLTVPAFLARSAWAASSEASNPKGGLGENILVVIQLSGGNDGLNTVIPFADDGYGRNRITLRIADNQVLKLNDQTGLHPQMEGFKKLFESQRLAIVQGVGYPNPDRSHFRSMDIWHTAKPEREDKSDGWLGRTIDSDPREAGQDVPALHLGPNQLPLALVSQRTPVPSIESMAGFRLQTAGGALPLASLAQLAEAARPDSPPLLDFLRRSTLNAYASSAQVQEALKEERSEAAYPDFVLAQKLKQIAQLIDAKLSTRIYYVSLDGFDTHANQAPAQAALLNQLSASVSAFVEDLAQRGLQDRVMVLSFSEFGRRVRENASQGTDHGTAAPVFLAGGRVAAGLIGAQPSLGDLDGEGDLKFHTDFRRLYASLLDGWLGCPSEKVLGQHFEPLAIVQG
ncbi:MAG TPA: DUF1501 domain-containing protein [Pirellulales bacterium]|nr:DUF1501 domain-containing protein [Pirellulales bacterium]